MRFTAHIIDFFITCFFITAYVIDIFIIPKSPKFEAQKHDS